MSGLMANPDDGGRTWITTYSFLWIQKMELFNYIV